ncbi:dTDP-4-amino-4,6-dideoxygalactose transaminase [Prochlorococcus marinus str. MIT 1313]|uniref:DegT/DnrJ/EryC1/StrS family aminotransferase n=1 Tax=Prochlorococcus TaxID=1218 RepID=UPI0007B3D3AC|nr:DegT/DnrJ/EryC1/StrS family aminotransferase [Prochlorococcus marinus]KZR70269.1 dTDP-4-amino-4,6-dideoxygalactose transaminase [Prochlorococcus marinus str. MIT 1313]KZR70741.1 dTDP-4-amino-4,6-dideoxygalactose transaminase [Prochlorococcus marinus str. MIT 1318]
MPLARIFDYSLPVHLQVKFLFDCIKIINRGFLTNDRFVKKFETKLEKLYLDKKVICTSSGTSALLTMLSCVSKPGDHIILPNNTFIATWQAAAALNLIIHVVDTNESGIGICPISLESTLDELNSRNIHPLAILDVHIGGFISKHWEKVLAISNKYHILYLEDSAQAFNALTICGKLAGSIGHMAIHSFHLTKNLTAGEGGALILHKNDIHLAKSFRQFGMCLDNPLLFKYQSLNSKMSEFIAAFGARNLECVHNKIFKRRQIMNKYKLLLDPSRYQVYDDILMGSFSSSYKTIVKVDDSYLYNKIMNYSDQIPLTGYVYKYTLNQQPVVLKSSDTFFHGTLNNSIGFSCSHICPPTYPELSLRRVDLICQFLNKI